jgi:D-psicose/D-tagatose/L-ribulose 3-epimerase
VPEPGELELARPAAGPEPKRASASCSPPVVNLQRNLASADAGARQAGVDYLKYAVDCAVALGADIVGGPLYGNPLVYAGRAPTPGDRGGARWRAFSAPSTAWGPRRPTPPRRGSAWPSSPSTGSKPTSFRPPARAWSSMQALPPSVGLLLDSFHMAMEEASRWPRRSAWPGPPAPALPGQREPSRLSPAPAPCPGPRSLRPSSTSATPGPLSLEPFRRRDERFGISFAQWRPPQENEDESLRASARFLREQLHRAYGNPAKRLT